MVPTIVTGVAYLRIFFVLKDLWEPLFEAAPVDPQALLAWHKNQAYGLAVIRLSCDAEVSYLITDAETGRSAWDTLAATYASTNTTNVMRLEEAFGIARKSKFSTHPTFTQYCGA